LSETFAFELLKRLAPQVITNEPDKAWEIVRMTGGLPLALVLIGNHLRIQSISGRERRIQAALYDMTLAEKRFAIAQTQSVLDSKRNPSLPFDKPISLSVIIDVSFDTLTFEEKTAMEALSLFPPKPNTFSEAAALFVADTNTDVLDALSDCGLLETDENERYTLHQSIHDYAQLKTNSKKSQERFIHYFRDFAQTHEAEQAKLTRELDNISRALVTAQQINRHDLLWQLLDGIFPFLEEKGHYDLARNYLNLLVEHDFLPAAKARILQHSGRIAYKSESNRIAADYWKQGLAAARKGKAQKEELSLLIDLSMIYSEDGEYVVAAEYLQQAIEPARVTENWYELCRILGNRGRLAVISEQYAEADKFLIEALELAKKYDWPTFVCFLYNMRGLVARNLGQPQAAYQQYFAGLQVARQHRFTTRIVEQLVNLGELLNEMERLEEAEAYLEEGLMLARKLGDHSKEGHFLQDLGILASHQMQYDKANDYLAKGCAIAEKINDLRLLALILVRWGEVRIVSGQFDEAKQLFKRALELVPTISRNSEVAGLAHFGLGKTALAQADLGKTRFHIDLALDATKGTDLALYHQVLAWQSQNL
jgi:tetratricopeptide (TPR) repeat protein